MKSGTDEAAQLGYQECAACGSVWYFARSFCPRCHGLPVDRCADGAGTVAAVTEVHRATRDEGDGPFTLVLVDAVEGFRLMARSDPGVTIGQRVRIEFRRVAGRPQPYCR